MTLYHVTVSLEDTVPRPPRLFWLRLTGMVRGALENRAEGVEGAGNTKDTHEYYCESYTRRVLYTAVMKDSYLPSLYAELQLILNHPALMENPLTVKVRSLPVHACTVLTTQKNAEQRT